MASRSVLRAPSFAIPAISLLALGIGSSSALFSIVYALLLNPLPYPESNRIYWVWATSAQHQSGAFAIEDYEEMARRNRTFSSLAALHNEFFDARLGGEPERLVGMVCTASFSRVMGSPAFLGRGFIPEDDAASTRAVLLSYQLWQERFGGKREVIGAPLMLNTQSFVIVGVMPPEFRFPAFAQLWVSAAPRAATATGQRSLEREAVVGRLRVGVGAAQATEDLQRVLAELHHEALLPLGIGVRIVTLQERLVSGYQATLVGLLGAAGVLLLVACAAVANLSIARALHQQPAWSLRLALGARWRDLLVPLFAEGLTVSLPGALLGLAIGAWGVRALLLAFLSPFPRSWEIGLRPAVVVFALAAAVGASFFSSVMTLARLSPKKLAESLRTGQQPTRTGARTEFLSGAIVSAQVMAGVILIVAALWFGRSVEKTLAMDLGMSRNFFMFGMDLSARQFALAETRAQFCTQLQERISALPGVQAVGISNDSPPGPQTRFESMHVLDQPARAPGNEIRAAVHSISPGFFSALEIPVREGRGFTERDDAGHPRVIVVNETMARNLWPGKSAVGQRIRFDSAGAGAWLEVVGVAANARHGGPTEDFGWEAYISLLQEPPAYVVFSVRSQAEMGGVLRAIRTEVEREHPEQFVLNVFTLERYIETWLASWRFNMVVMRIFGALAFSLSVAGVFSLLSYRVAQCKREFGVRMALGASKRDVLLHVLRQGMRLVAVGVVTGAAGVLLLAKFAAQFFSEPISADWDALVLACVVIAAAALGACWWPARRATQVDPLVALRHE